jgi:hypothetical protein
VEFEEDLKWVAKKARKSDPSRAARAASRSKRAVGQEKNMFLDMHDGTDSYCNKNLPGDSFADALFTLLILLYRKADFLDVFRSIEFKIFPCIMPFSHYWPVRQEG